MSRAEGLLEALGEGEAIRCENRERGLSWVFLIEDGDVIRIHEEDSERKQVSREMAELSIAAVAVTTEIVPIEEVAER